MTQVSEHLSSKHEAQSSNPTKKNPPKKQRAHTRDYAVRHTWFEQHSSFDKTV
jgi:hypothetical protein